MLIATVGNGHAYKVSQCFSISKSTIYYCNDSKCLSVLGLLIADRLENTIDPSLVKKFASDRAVCWEWPYVGKTRAISVTKELDLSDLSTADYLMTS
jgi:hypothetical protein